MQASIHPRAANSRGKCIIPQSDKSNTFLFLFGFSTYARPYAGRRRTPSPRLRVPNDGTMPLVVAQRTPIQIEIDQEQDLCFLFHFYRFEISSLERFKKSNL